MNDTLFDAQLKESLLLAATVDFAEVLSEPEDVEPEWTLRYRHQRKKMLENPNKWMREKVRPVWKKTLQAAACLLLAASLTLGTLMAVSPTVRAAVLNWIKTFSQGEVLYQSAANQNNYDHPPTWRPTWLPEEWVLTGVSGSDSLVRWTYCNAQEGTLSFICSYPADLAIGYTIKNEDIESMQQPVTIQGFSADLYAGEQQMLLTWENDDGLLFFLSSMSMSADDLLRTAESVQPYSGETLAYTLEWLPNTLETLDSDFSAPGCGSQTWFGAHATFHWFYVQESAPLNLPDWEFETIIVNGWEGRYWAPTQAIRPDVGGTVVQDENGKVIEKAITGHLPEESGTLVWTDMDSGTSFFMQGTVSRDDLMAMAEQIKENGLPVPTGPEKSESPTPEPTENTNSVSPDAPESSSDSGDGDPDSANLSSPEEPTPVSGESPTYQLNWVPDGYTCTNHVKTTTAIVERWSNGESKFTFLFGTDAKQGLPDEPAQPVTVNESQGSYWDSSDSVSNGATESVLIWTADGTVLRIQGVLEQDTLLRMAESVTEES